MEWYSIWKCNDIHEYANILFPALWKQMLYCSKNGQINTKKIESLKNVIKLQTINQMNSSLDQLASLFTVVMIYTYNDHNWGILIVWFIFQIWHIWHKGHMDKATWLWPYPLTKANLSQIILYLLNFDQKAGRSSFCLLICFMGSKPPPT